MIIIYNKFNFNLTKLAFHHEILQVNMESICIIFDIQVLILRAINETYLLNLLNHIIILILNVNHKKFRRFTKNFVMFHFQC